MAVPSNTTQTYQAVGNREDLTDVIYNIAPTETPFLSMCGTTEATSTKHEWQTDDLAAAANNKQVEGDDAAPAAATPTVRVDNQTQISSKTVSVSGTQDAVSSAGRKKELAYQVSKRGKEIKRDMEFALTQNTTAIAGNAATARQLRGLEGWIATNNSLGATGVAPNPINNTAPTDGTQRAFTESLLKDVLQQCWNNGGDPDVVMVGGAQKQVFSTFTGGSTKQTDSKDKKVVATVDIYVSDFGTLKVVPNRFQRARTAFALQSDMWEVAYLRRFKTEPLAKTGDSEKRMLLAEYTLKAKNEKSSGAVRDLS